MKLGFFTMPIHPVDKDWRLSLKEDREAFLLADELGFTRGLCRRARHRQGREHHILHRLYRLACSSDQTDQARYRHRQHAEHPSGRACRLDRDARSHARRTPDLRHQSRRTAVGRGSFRQSRSRPKRDVPGSNQPGPSDLGERAAVQSAGQILERIGAKDPDRGHRSGLHRTSSAKAASTDRGDGGGPVLKGCNGSSRARMGSDLGELPDAGLGEKPLAEIR